MTDTDFNPEQFLEGATVDGELSTQFTPVPEGTYRAQIEPITKDSFRQVDTKSGKRVVFRVVWNVLDDAVRAELERDKVTINQDLWLDMDENGALDTGKGKNVDLGRLRDALGQNDKSGWRFGDLAGQMATIRTRVRSDKDDPSKKYAEVARVTAID